MVFLSVSVLQIFQTKTLYDSSPLRHLSHPYPFIYLTIWRLTTPIEVYHTANL